MTKKNGCIYLRGHIWWVKYYQRGKAIFESTKSDDRRVAEKLLLQREIEAEQDKLPNFKAERTKVDELLEDLLRDYRIHDKRTLRSAKETVLLLKKHFGEYKAHDISPNLINKFIDTRKRELCANGTINRALALLKRAFNLGIRDGKALKKPYIEKLKENNIRRGFFEHDEFVALRSALPDYLKVLVTVAYHTGMRRGEVLSLKWDQIDLKGGIIRLEQEDTKNAQPRTIYINDEIWAMFVAQKRDRDLRFPNMPFVFYTPKGEPIGDFRGVWDTACKKAGIQGKIFHDFRRTAVRNMVRAGVPERVAMSISGHRTRSIFDRYNIVSEEDLKLATKRVDVYLQAKAEAENPYRELEEIEQDIITNRYECQ